MPKGSCSSAAGALASAATVFLLTWATALQGVAQAEAPKGSGREAKSGVAARPVEGRNPKASANEGGAREHLPKGPISGPLRASKNPNYFADAAGDPLILCGSHTWNTLQDWGTNGTVQLLDFAAFIRFLKEHGHNFTLLWYTELPRFRGLPTTGRSPPDFTVGPHPWRRTGPGNATDGGLRFDLTAFNPGYFDRLRTRVQALHAAGIYVGVYLFTGEFQLRFRFRSDGYPFSGPNNVNGVDDGYRGGPPRDRAGFRDHDRPQRHHGFSGRLREEGHRHVERPAQRALDRFRRGADPVGLVE
jgi:hypothetical protein